MKSPFAILIAGLVLLVAACTATGTAGGGGPPVSRGNLITAEEAQATNQSNAYDVVQARRPSWLRVRGVQTMSGGGGGVIVYLDALRLGGTGALRQISISSVASIEYYDPTSAVQRWGIDHEFGVIVVNTR